MELPKMKKAIVDANGNIDLTIVGRDQTAGG